MTDAATPARTDRRYVPWYRRLIPSRRTVVIGILLVLASPIGVRWYRLWCVPNVPVPFDVQEFLNDSLPDEQNAYRYFEKAAFMGQGIRPQEELGNRFVAEGKTFSWNDVPEEQRPWVEKGSQALTIFREGARCPSGSFHVPLAGYNAATSLPNIRLHDLFWLALLESLRQMHDGHPEAAAEILHDTYRASRLWGSKGWLNERNTGVWYHRVAVRGWHEWTRQPDVTTEQLQAALERIQSDWKLTLPPSEILKADYLTITNEAKFPLTILRKEWHADIDRWWRLHVFDEPIKPRLDAWERQCPGWQLPILWTLGEPDIMLRAAKLRLTHQLKTCDLPLAEQPSDIGNPYHLRRIEELTAGLTADELNARLQLSPLLWHLGWVESTYQMYWSEAAQQMLLVTEFQLQMLFRKQTVRSRAAAEEALTDFIWPIDPCSPADGPLQFRAVEDGLLIWSLGRDLADQGGSWEPNVYAVDLLLLIPWPEEE